MVLHEAISPCSVSVNYISLFFRAVGTGLCGNRPDGVTGVGIDKNRANWTVGGRNHLGPVDFVSRSDNAGRAILAAGVGRSRVECDWAEIGGTFHCHVKVGRARDVELET